MIYKVRRLVDEIEDYINELDENNVKQLAKVRTDVEIIRNLIPEEKYRDVRDLINDLNVQITKVLFKTSKDPKKSIELIVDMLRCLSDMSKLSYV